MIAVVLAFSEYIRAGVLGLGDKLKTSVVFEAGERLQLTQAMRSDLASAIDHVVTVRHRSEFASRILNILLAVALLVLLAPLFLVIGIAVKLSSPGPIFYRQLRIGQSKRATSGGAKERGCNDYSDALYYIYKFRTTEAAIDASDRRPRIRGLTPLGRLLERTSLDELPQLVNVLRGEMNLVGPRPQRPDEFDLFTEVVPENRARLCAKPGITGWAQVRLYDHDRSDVAAVIKDDLEYLQKQSILEDLKIMLMTIPTILLKPER